jgi:peptide deformylase
MPADPSTLRIIHYPDPRLRRKGVEVPQITDEVRRIAERMIVLMQEADGIGLAAPQVGIPWRMFVAHVPPTEKRSAEADPPTATTGPSVYINPVLSDPRGEMEGYEEGCLSLPEITGEVLRPTIITITATDLEGNRFTRTGAGLLARCWQHETDHLDGILILDRMSQLSRLKSRPAVRKLERDAMM